MLLGSLKTVRLLPQPWFCKLHTAQSVVFDFYLGLDLKALMTQRLMVAAALFTPRSPL